MSQLPRGWRIHLAAGILVLQEHLVIAITSLFYIDHRLIVVYIVLVGYLVSKCDSEAARGKLNSLSDPLTSMGFIFVREALSYRIVLSFCYRIVSYQIREKEKTQNTKYQKIEAYNRKWERIRKNTQKNGRNVLTNGMIKAGHRHGVISSYMCALVCTSCVSE
jgi:hypothetical protein